MSGYITDPIDDARQYAAAYMRSRSEAGTLMQDVVWSRQGLCYAIFDMLEILPPEGMRKLFKEGD
jgi:hypothetical protein